MSTAAPTPTGAAFGQAGIAVREALTRGDAAGAARAASGLDEAHHVEILLGALIRRADVSGVSFWLTGDVAGVCARLAVPAATPLDDLAVSYVLRRVVPEGWRPDGPAADFVLEGPSDVARALQAGCGGLALLRQLEDRPLHQAVRCYYAPGRIHALGCRPLLILAGA